MHKPINMRMQKHIRIHEQIHRNTHIQIYIKAQAPAHEITHTHAKNDLQVLEEGCYVLLALRITLYVMPVFDCGMQCEGDTDRQTETARQRDREREKRQSDGLSKLLLLWYELCHYVALS